MSPEHRAKIIAALTGRKLSPLHRQRIADAAKRFHWNVHAKQCCPHCGAQGVGPVMYRHHFDRCQMRSMPCSQKQSA